LLGFGFLAGATLDLPDPLPRPRGWRGWLSRRSLWVAVGPWTGPAWAAGIAAAWVYGPASLLAERFDGPPDTLRGTWVAAALGWAFLVGLIGVLGYAWVLPAWAVLRRAREAGPGRAWTAITRGVAVAAAFVGSLFGTFWAITEGARGFFFDPKVFPVVVAALGLVALEGCASTVTYGEVRRRELFRALLLAWVFGLALTWLWWSRPRTKRR
jgi:hypothetical protein